MHHFSRHNRLLHTRTASLLIPMLCYFSATRLHCRSAGTSADCPYMKISKQSHAHAVLRTPDTTAHVHALVYTSLLRYARVLHRTSLYHAMLQFIGHVINCSISSCSVSSTTTIITAITTISSSVTSSSVSVSVITMVFSSPLSLCFQQGFCASSFCFSRAVSAAVRGRVLRPILICAVWSVSESIQDNTQRSRRV
jgi:hypothetical protein